MRIQVKLSAGLKALAGGKLSLQAQGNTVSEVIAHLEEEYPGFASAVCDSKGKIKPFILLFVGKQNIRQLQNERTPLRDGDHVSFIQAVAGG